jgi:hypothetical protein
MAGTNQAVNLGGMMNQIAGTIGSGYTINGKNAGAAIGDTLANLARPDVENGTAEEYERLAEWASKNGRDVEYAQASQQAARAQKEQRTMEAMVGVSAAGDLANRSAQQGDIAGIAKQQQDIRAKMAQYQKENNFEGFQAAQQELKRIDQMVPQAQEVETDNKAAGYTNLRKILNDGGYYGKDKEGNDTFIPLDKNGDQKAQIEQTMRALEADTDTVRKANAQILQQHQADVAQKAMQTDNQVDGLQAQLNQANDEDSLDLLLAGIEDADVRRAMIPLVNEKRTQIARQQERQAQRLELETPVVSDADYERMAGMVEEIAMGDPNDPVAMQAQKLLDTYANLDESNKTAGVYHDVGGRERTAKAAQKAEEFIAQQWGLRMEGKRREAVAADNEKKQILLEAQGATLVSPPETEISNYQRANDVSRADAVDALTTQAEENYFNLLMEYDPETAQKTLQDGLTIDKLVTKMGNGTSPAKVEAVLRDYYGYPPEQAEAITEAAVRRADREVGAAQRRDNPMAPNAGTSREWAKKFWDGLTTPTPAPTAEQIQTQVAQGADPTMAAAGNFSGRPQPR